MGVKHIISITIICLLLSFGYLFNQINKLKFQVKHLESEITAINLVEDSDDKYNNSRLSLLEMEVKSLKSKLY